MGCDIHSMVEIRSKRYEGSWMPEGEKIAGIFEPGSERWVALDRDDDGGRIFPNTDYREDATYEPFTHRYRFAPLDARNYVLYALLANVRNYNDGIQPLAEARGVPDDASFDWLEEVDRWSVDMHSHSWFTLAELLAFREAGRLSAGIKRAGLIHGDQYEKIKASGEKPTSWAGGIFMRDSIQITAAEYDAGQRAEAYTPEQIAVFRSDWESSPYFKGWTPEKEEHFARSHSQEYRTIIAYEWEDDLVGSVGELNDAIDALVRYAEDRPPKGRVDEGTEDKPGWYGHGALSHDDIRIVFGFDN